MAMPSSHERAGSDLLFLREESLRLAQTLMFLAARDMAEAVAPVLEEDGLGRAHYRVLQVLAFSPGIPVSRLQDILGVTKQSLGRTLQELDARAYLQSSVGRQDRRQKLLCLSPEARRPKPDCLPLSARGWSLPTGRQEVLRWKVFGVL